MLSTKNRASKKTVIIFLSLAILTYLSFAFYHLSEFETVDEHYWIYDPGTGRVDQYWKAILSGDWKHTYINDKPGVTVALISGIGNALLNVSRENIFSDHDYYRIYDPGKIRTIDLFFRVPIIIFNAFGAIIIFWLIRRITQNDWIALWSTIFILTSPIIVGVSQIVNPDALLWLFSAISILSFLDYLKSEEKKSVAISAASLGLALLTKYAALVLIPFYLSAFLMIAIFRYSDWKGDTGRKIGRFAAAHLCLIAGAFLVFAIFLPAGIVNPKIFYAGTIGFSGMSKIFWATVAADLLFILDAFLNRGRIMNLAYRFIAKAGRLIFSIPIFLVLAVFLITFLNHSSGFRLMPDLRKIPFDSDMGIIFGKQQLHEKIFLEAAPLIFSVLPLVFFLLFFVLAKSFWKKTEQAWIVASTAVFIAAFYGAVIYQGLLVNIRYTIMLYPLIFILSAIGIWELFSWKRIAGIKKEYLTAGLLIIGAASLWSAKPFYFNYTNAFLPQKSLIADSWGYGGYEAAEHLNALPGAEKMVVWADQNGFCPFFKGICIKGDLAYKRNASTGELDKIDYVVRTRRGSVMYADTWKEIKKNIVNYSDAEPVWRISINGRDKNYVEVYKAQK
ncbi:MAG: phospholipid carrier-dependent glycosyltransferase [Candidatus Moranbacteria bacterium]|nr:phospholipid carrier-dependent glycosyltransferase [Candidatus Moranbacteria bacterium]